MQLKAEYRREWLHSTVPGVDYLSNVFLLGAAVAEVSAALRGAGYSPTKSCRLAMRRSGLSEQMLELVA